LEVEEQTRQKAAKEKAEREATEKTAREKAEQVAAGKLSLKVEELAKPKAAQDGEESAINNVLLYLKSKSISFTLIFVGALIGMSLLFFLMQNHPSPISHGNLYFTSNHGGQAQVYKVDSKGRVVRIMRTDWAGKSWSPAPNGNGNLYFTSNHDGQAQIYKLDSKGLVVRVMRTDWAGESWSPAPDGRGNLYFTSSHDGKNQIYILDTKGQVAQVTMTDWQGASWLGTRDEQDLGY
jgi:WD40 repeat protein